MAEIFDLDAGSVDSGNTTVAPDTTTVAPDTTTVVPDTTSAPVTTDTKLPDVEPSWMDELSGLMDNPQQQVVPQYQPPPQQYYPPPQQQWQQPPQQWQQPDPQAELDNLLRNPQAYIQNVASMATAGQQQYVRQMEEQVRNLAVSNANQSWDQARKAIEDGYRNVLNKDNTFKGNENVKKTVELMLQRAMGAVRSQISMGNYAAGQAMMDPTFFPGMLYIAKLKCGVGFTGKDAMAPVGATMEGVTPPAQQQSGPRLDPDLQGVADFLGPAFEKELKSMVASADERGDFSWKG